MESVEQLKSVAGATNGTEAPATDKTSDMSMASRAIHADDSYKQTTDVSPAMHLSTTFHYEDDPEKLVMAKEAPPHQLSDPPVYSRLSSPTTTRLETVLSSLTHGRALTYTSGLAAFHALITYFNPSKIAIGAGYHGCHGVLSIHTKLSGLKKLPLHASDVEWDASGLGAGDIVHVETPLNPTGEIYNLKGYAERAHARGALLTVDATFGPPGLQDPFTHGADVVMHSGTKYLGGHSDMLCGVLALRDDEHAQERWSGLYEERLHLGSVMGNLEAWMGIRSLRTLELRVKRQSENAMRLVEWLDRALHNDNEDTGNEVTKPTPHDVKVVQASVSTIHHATTQFPRSKPHPPWATSQMPNGYGPVFALTLKTKDMARRLPSALQLFHHATSLGGVESLIEWRAMSDDAVDERLVRVSVGVEGWEDLSGDLSSGLAGVAGV
ncbi:MAG: hypothetical protein M1831_006429 [Alyxoria varia]|nr:MAG: hypothetical protein M1831_006429 [Alyxoria varia]